MKKSFVKIEMKFSGEFVEKALEFLKNFMIDFSEAIHAKFVEICFKEPGEDKKPGQFS